MNGQPRPGDVKDEDRATVAPYPISMREDAPQGRYELREALQRTAPAGPNGLPVADDAPRLPAPARDPPTDPKMDGRLRVRGAGPRFSGNPLDARWIGVEGGRKRF